MLVRTCAKCNSNERVIRIIILSWRYDHTNAPEIGRFQVLQPSEPAEAALVPNPTAARLLRDAPAGRWLPPSSWHRGRSSRVEKEAKLLVIRTLPVRNAGQQSERHFQHRPGSAAGNLDRQ
jgi:hypothetical protein